MKKPRSHSDNAARESLFLDRSDWKEPPGQHANCVNTMITLPRVLGVHPELLHHLEPLLHMLLNPPIGCSWVYHIFNISAVQSEVGHCPPSQASV